MNKSNPSSTSLYSQTVLLVGVTILLLLLGGISLSYFKTMSLISTSQNESNLELAEGVARSLTDEIVSRDYGTLESQLQLILLNKNLYSAMVTDTSGKILVYLTRNESDGQIFANFKQTFVELPATHSDQARNQLGDQRGQPLMIWKKIEAGLPIGWLRLEVGDSKTEAILSKLKFEMFLIAAVCILAVFALLSFFLLRIYKKLNRNEMQLNEKNRVLEFDALHDALTQLPNRRLLTDRLQQAIYDADRKNTVLVVCFIDLDGFKEVNDEYGHEVGDRVLVEVKDRLLSTLRRGDTLSRLGGDEFVLVLPDIAQWVICEKVLHRLLELLSRPYIQKGRNITSVSASLGVAMYPQDGADPVSLIDRADMAMYAAKRAGKASLRRYADMDAVTSAV